MPKVVEITLPETHPLSPEYLETLDPAYAKNIRKAVSTYECLCPECFGVIPTEAKFCPWCVNCVRALAN